MNKTTRRQLKQQAHKLKPVVILGSQGLTESVQNEINVALEAHELIKIRINAASKEERQAIISSICNSQKAELVNLIGHIATVFRQNQS